MSRTKPGSPLVRQPWLYEFIYPEAGHETADACVKILGQFQPEKGLSVLEIGSGTGRMLARLKELGYQVTGVDISKPMIDYAAVLRPDIRVVLGDMRSFKLDEQFDVVICAGSTFTYNLRNTDVHSSLECFRRHCVDGGLVIIGMLNASRFIGSETFHESMELRIEEGEFHATAFSRHILDRNKQSFRRVRTWKIDGQDEPVIDDAEFRLFFPLEIEDYLTQHRFSVLGFWDNKELRQSDLSDRRIYVAARAV